METTETPRKKTTYQQKAMDYAEQFLDRLMHVEDTVERRKQLTTKNNKER